MNPQRNLYKPILATISKSIEPYRFKIPSRFEAHDVGDLISRWYPKGTRTLFG
jgi:hypothetical protein